MPLLCKTFIKVIDLSLTSCKSLQKSSRSAAFGQRNAVQERKLPCTCEGSLWTWIPHARGCLGYFRGAGEPRCGGVHPANLRFLGMWHLAPRLPAVRAHRIVAGAGLVLAQGTRSYWEPAHWHNWASHQALRRSGKILRRFLFLGIRVLSGILWGAYLHIFNFLELCYFKNLVLNTVINDEVISAKITPSRCFAHVPTSFNWILFLYVGFLSQE